MEIQVSKAFQLPAQPTAASVTSPFERRTGPLPYGRGSDSTV